MIKIYYLKIIAFISLNYYKIILKINIIIIYNNNKFYKKKLFNEKILNINL